MFKRVDLTPVEAASKAFGPATLEPSPATVSSHWPTGHLLQQKSCKSGSPAFAGLRRDRHSRGYSACFTLNQCPREIVRGFTLVELLVTMSVLVLLVFLFSQLLNSAATTVTLANKLMDADSQARQFLDRIAIDFDQMVKRTDVSYYVKALGSSQAGNDQIAFFSAVPGYYSQNGYNSNASLVAYRVNADSVSASYNKLERMGKGLALNGAYVAPIPLLFLDSTTSPTTTIQNIWPAAASSTIADSNYETAGAQVFRFEYYYLLNTALSANALSNGAVPNQLSAGPWSNVNSFVINDVAAIVVAIAVMEPKSKVLLTNDQVAALAGTLPDFKNTMGSPGVLLTQWQAALDANTTLPRPAISGIRLYERYFYLYQ